MALQVNGIDIANGIVFQQLDICKDTFDDRLVCQKKIYLLQSLGTDLGYAYNWYVRGPYSPALTSYVFNHLEMLSAKSFDQYKLSYSAEKNISTVRSLADKGPEDLSVPSWYELLASIQYIFDHPDSWKHNKKDDELKNILMKNKPQYTESHCNCALDILKQNAFIKAGE